jgi:hypothetical protein
VEVNSNSSTDSIQKVESAANKFSKDHVTFECDSTLPYSTFLPGLALDGDRLCGAWGLDRIARVPTGHAGGDRGFECAMTLGGSV